MSFRFCQVAKDLTKAPNPQTLTHFILPLASAYLCSEKYARKNNIVDAAVEVSWFQFWILLKQNI